MPGLARCSKSKQSRVEESLENSTLDTSEMLIDKPDNDINNMQEEPWQFVQFSVRGTQGIKPWEPGNVSLELAVMSSEIVAG